MAISNETKYSMDHMCPVAAQAALGTMVQDTQNRLDAIEAGTSLNFAEAGDMAAAGVAAANAAGSSVEVARGDHVHAMPFSAVNTALGAANASIAVNSQKITGLANGAAAQDAAALGQLSRQFVSVAIGGEVGNKRIITGTYADATGAAIAGSANIVMDLFVKTPDVGATVAPEAGGGTALFSLVASVNVGFIAFQTAADGTFAIGVTLPAGANELVVRITGLAAEPYVGYTTYAA